MALDGDRLAAAMKTTIKAKVLEGLNDEWPLTAIADETLLASATAQRSTFAEIIAEAVSQAADDIVNEIANNAEVSTTMASSAISVASVSGVTAGAANSGPGTGTIDNATATGSIT